MHGWDAVRGPDVKCRDALWGRRTVELGGRSAAGRPSPDFPDRGKMAGRCCRARGARQHRCLPRRFRRRRPHRRPPRDRTGRGPSKSLEIGPFSAWLDSLVAPRGFPRIRRAVHDRAVPGPGACRWDSGVTGSLRAAEETVGAGHAGMSSRKRYRLVAAQAQTARPTSMCAECRRRLEWRERWRSRRGHVGRRRVAQCRDRRAKCPTPMDLASMQRCSQRSCGNRPVVSRHVRRSHGRVSQCALTTAYNHCYTQSRLV